MRSRSHRRSRWSSTMPGVIGFSLNGKSFPATEPYVVNTGDWLMVHYYNEGLQSHPMHQHQFPQLIIAKDGFPARTALLGGHHQHRSRRAVHGDPHAEDPGVWVWHCHILNHVEREEGMFGMVTALIVEDA
jgi:manganese oxidase